MLRGARELDIIIDRQTDRRTKQSIAVASENKNCVTTFLTILATWTSRSTCSAAASSRHSLNSILLLFMDRAFHYYCSIHENNRMFEKYCPMILFGQVLCFHPSVDKNMKEKLCSQKKTVQCSTLRTHRVT